MNNTKSKLQSDINSLNEVFQTYVLNTNALEILSYSLPLEKQIRALMRSQIDWTAPGSIHRIQPEQLSILLQGAENEVNGGFQPLKFQLILALWSTLEVLI